MSEASFFTVDGDHVVATDYALGPWSTAQVGGHAVCGLFARELERHSPGDDFIPARLTVDLFRPVLTQPISVQSVLVRRGRRIVVADASIVQDGDLKARATAVFLIRGARPPGDVWRAADDLPTPPPIATFRPGGASPLLKSGAGEWTADIGSNQNADRKSIWQNLVPLVAGEPMSPFQNAAVVAENTSFVTNWGSEGVGFINTDLTMTLSRLPSGHELGVHAADHIVSAGIAVGSGTLFDRAGPLGTCVITAVSNERRQVDFTDADKQWDTNGHNPTHRG